jgi:hypothetical protein
VTPEGTVARHLAATRITEAVGPLDGPIAKHYKAWFSDLTERLARRFGELEPTDLFVTCTANAESELLVGEDWRVIVHDQHFGRTLNRLTTFVLRSWPVTRVQAWAFERIAVVALERGDLDSTQLALALSSTLSQIDDPPEEEPVLDAARALMVEIGEFFVLAHEVAHTALGEGAYTSLEKHLYAELEESFEQERKTSVENRDLISRQMVDDVAHALNQHLRSEPSAADLRRLREIAPIDGDRKEIEWLANHKFLYEELACDQIATELTIERFRDWFELIDTQTVLPAILMTLHHLTSLEYLRAIGRGDRSTIAPTIRSTMLRKSVWRTMTRRMYHDQSAAPLGELYVSVTQDHAHKLGDQVLFIVPILWDKARESLARKRGGGAPLEPDLQALREIVWSHARPVSPRAFKNLRKSP